MNRQVVGWSVGFLATSALAVTLLVSTCRAKGPVEAQAVAKRDSAKVTNVELELILNKVREGDLRALQKDLEGARRAWQEARRLGEGLWPIHEGLGDSFWRAKLYEDAVREYRTAEPLVPERHGAMRQTIVLKRAEALAAWDRPLEALQSYLDVNQPGPLAAKILDQALKVSDRDAAAKLLSQRAEIYDARLFHLVSAFYTKIERKAEAAEALARFALAVAPWDESLDRAAIEGLRAARKFDLAIEVCRAWVRSTPQALHAYQLMGDLHREAGREKEAIVAYTSIVDVRPGDAQAHRMLGDIFKGLNRLDDAVTQYEAARKARPEDQVTWTTLVALYDAKGDSAKAEETMLQATKRFGITGELRSRLVASYQERIGKLKAEGKAEEVRAIRRKLADLNVAEMGLFDLKIIMTWDARSDVDMDVYEPDGERVLHGHPHSKAGGHYYVDNTQGYGPETYTLPKAAPGTYRVGAHLHGEVRSTARFIVILYEDTPREERREETLVLEKSGEQKFIRHIVITR